MAPKKQVQNLHTKYMAIAFQDKGKILQEQAVFLSVPNCNIKEQLLDKTGTQ